MDPDTPPAQGSLESQPSLGYVSSESESRAPATRSSSRNNRASRAGTRSVSALSAAQLERKRANDREAQRAIRQRTKDHIDHLEKTVRELRLHQESHEKLAAATRRRNRELEEENAYLRSRLNRDGYSSNLPPVGTRPQHALQCHSSRLTRSGERSSELGQLSLPSASPSTTHSSGTGSSTQRSTSVSTPRSMSLPTSAASNSHHALLQQSASFGSDDLTGDIQGTNLSAWKQHDPMETTLPVHSAPPHAPDSSHPQSPSTSFQIGRTGHVEWVAAAHTHHFPADNEQPQQNCDYHHPAPTQFQPQQLPYVHPEVQNFVPAPVPPHQAYHSPQMQPRAARHNEMTPGPLTGQYSEKQEFQQSLQRQQAQSFTQSQQQQTYQQSESGLRQMAHIQMQPAADGYASATSHMRPPSLPTSAYPATASEQHYTALQHHFPIQFHDDSPSPAYVLKRYSPG